MWTFHTAQVTLGLELETHQRRKPTATRSMERLSSGHLCQLIVNMIVIFVIVIVNTIVIFVIVIVNMTVCNLCHADQECDEPHEPPLQLV